MATKADFDAEAVQTFAIDLAKRAGKVILDGSSKRFADQAASAGTQSSSSTADDLIKKNTADLVTEVDQATEEFVKWEIQKKYPSHKFIGEESWAAGQQNQLEDAPSWIVDPIDGTTNFVSGFPFVAISIGITYKSKAVIGVVYAPFLDTLYYAREGAGAFVESPQHRQARKLPLNHPLPLPSLKQAVVAVEWGSDRKASTTNRKSDFFAKLCGDADQGVEGGQMVRGVRSIGSAALSCCFVAEGSLDLWHEVGCWIWDVCAGIVLLQESGALVVGAKQDTLDKIQSKSNELGVATPELLQGRKYLVVRNTNPREDQIKTIKAFYQTMDEWDAA